MTSLTYLDSDGARREVNGCTLTKDKRKLWFCNATLPAWIENINHSNITHKTEGKFCDSYQTINTPINYDPNM